MRPSTRSRLHAGSHSRCLGSGASVYRASLKLSLPDMKPKQVLGSASLVTFALLVEPGVSSIDALNFWACRSPTNSATCRY